MRKVCVVVHSRANYGRIKTVMREIQNHPDLELQLIVGSSALLLSVQEIELVEQRVVGFANG